VVKRPKYFGYVSAKRRRAALLKRNDATVRIAAIFVTASVILTARRDVLE
jgi:hypothetical protein